MLIDAYDHFYSEVKNFNLREILVTIINTFIKHLY